MVRFYIIALFLFSVACAQDAYAIALKQVQQPANVQIINGKKFFSLQNARRFTGSTNSPKALSVMSRAHADISRTRRTAPLRAGAAPGAKAPVNLDLSTSLLPRPASDQILSVFAPEDGRRFVQPALTK